MFCERTRRARGWLAGLLAATVLLSVPASGLAAEGISGADELATTGTLARGAGYGSQAGSEPVRELQRRLRRLGDRPGPIDGLYGPLTEGAVERFQQAHGLATDGIVGPQTKGRLLAQGAKRPVADNSRTPPSGKLERKSPVRGYPGRERYRAASCPQRAERGAEPRRPALVRPDRRQSSSRCWPSPLPLALLIALRAYGRRVREATVNFGMVCAALLAMFVIGAATGAVFATQAAPDAGGEASADSGALLAARSAPSHRPARAARRTRDGWLRRGVRGRRLRPAGPPRALDWWRAPRRGPLPRPSWYSHGWRRGRRSRRRTRSSRETRSGRSPSATSHPAARWRRSREKVDAIESLNAGRIASGDPDVLEAGEELRLP